MSVSYGGWAAFFIYGSNLFKCSTFAKAEQKQAGGPPMAMVFICMSPKLLTSFT